MESKLLKRIQQGPMSGMAVIMMTAYGSIPVAVEAMRLGAFDFVTKPFRNEDIFPLLARLDRSSRSRAEPAATEDPSQLVLDEVIVGSSPGMVRVRQMIEVCARTEANVLLLGETGCGKDLISRVIHGLSHRRSFPYVKVGCTLFPRTSSRASCTGTRKARSPGRSSGAKAASRWPRRARCTSTTSTTSPSSSSRSFCEQSKRRSMSGWAVPRPSRPTCGIIASTKRALLEKIGEGTFREDLYYRLDVLRIVVPPLRERLEDVPLLAEHLLKGIAGESVCQIDAGVLELLARHRWPGNVRELNHALERAYLVGSGRITSDLLQNEMAGLAAATTPTGKGLPAGDFQSAMDPDRARSCSNRPCEPRAATRRPPPAGAGDEGIHLSRQARQARAGVMQLVVQASRLHLAGQAGRLHHKMSKQRHWAHGGFASV